MDNSFLSQVFQDPNTGNMYYTIPTNLPLEQSDAMQSRFFSNLLIHQQETNHYQLQSLSQSTNQVLPNAIDTVASGRLDAHQVVEATATRIQKSQSGLVCKDTFRQTRNQTTQIESPKNIVSVSVEKSKSSKEKKLKSLDAKRSKKTSKKLQQLRQQPPQHQLVDSQQQTVTQSTYSQALNTTQESQSTLPTPSKIVQVQPSRESTSQDLAAIQTKRSEMSRWTVAEVVGFIEEHEDIKQYSAKFAEDEVDGKALKLMIDRNLNFQMLTSMFKFGPAMKIEAALSKYKLNE